MMRPLLTLPALGLASAVLSLTAGASARPIPLIEQGPDGSWYVPTRPTPVIPYSASPIESTDVLQHDLVLTVDPATGATSGELTLRIRAEQPSVGSLTLLIDPDLAFGGATVEGVSANITSQTFGSYHQGSISFPPLAQGEEATVVVDYAGTLTCSRPDSLCDVNPDMSVIMQGSGVPHVFDASFLGGYNVWGAPQSLELVLPSGTDAVVPGGLVFDEDDGTSHVRRWVVPGYHNAAGYLVMFGAFDSIDVVPSQPPTQVVYATSSPNWSDDMADWMVDILAFLYEQTGASLAFESLSAVKLPAMWVFPGTVGHGTVYLAESYGIPGADYFEETLAHETAHDWWGVLVSPTDLRLSRWLVEGLATLSQVDYAAVHFRQGLSREAYLRRRYREHAILLRYLAEPNLPAVLPQAPPEGLDGLQDSYWAYIRSSAALDSIRLVAGESAFADGLRAYREQCSQQLCDSVDFQAILESVSGVDLDAAFDGFVRSQLYPSVVMSFTTTGGDGSQSVAVSVEGIDAPLPMELVATLEDGSEHRQVVTLVPGAGATLTVPGPVRAVGPNPRHDATVVSRSAQPGDVDFGREVDGFDLVRCARAADTSAAFVDSGGEGVLRRLDLDFDPRCDLDGDGVVGDADLDLVLSELGALHPSSSQEEAP